MTKEFFIKRWLVFAVSLVLSILTARKQKADQRRIQRLDYSWSTQRLGVRFTESLRDRWRRRWLKVHR